MTSPSFFHNMRSSSLSGCSVWPPLLLSSFSTSKILSMCVFIFMTIMVNRIIKLIIIITNIFINSCLWWTATLSTWTQWRSFTPHHVMPALKKGPSLVQGSTHFSLFKIFSINSDGLSLYSECNKFSWSPWPKKFKVLHCWNSSVADLTCSHIRDLTWTRLMTRTLPSGRATPSPHCENSYSSHPCFCADHWIAPNWYNDFCKIDVDRYIEHDAEWQY